MKRIRVVARGERVENIINELKVRTFSTDEEYALVRLADGTRAIVVGDRDGITFEAGQINRLYGHTHPYSRPATGIASETDRNALKALGQSSSYVLEHGLLFKFWAT